MQRGRRWQLLQLLSLLALAGLVGIGLAAFDNDAGRDEPRTGNVASLLPEQAPVEYGASLAEWEEATQGSAEEPAAAAVAVAAEAPAASTGDAPDTAAFGVPVTFGDVVYDEILWDGLLPPEYSPDALMARFSDQLADLQDGSPEAQLIYTEMQEELNNAPVNQALDGTMIRLPGFIAPLNYQDDAHHGIPACALLWRVHPRAAPADQSDRVGANGRGPRHQDRGILRSDLGDGQAQCRGEPN